MDEAYENLAEQMRNGSVSYEPQRFDVRELCDVKAKGAMVTFYLESGTLTLPIVTLSRREASIAHRYYSRPDEPIRKEKYGFFERKSIEYFERYSEGRLWRLTLSVGLFIFIVVYILGSGLINYVNGIPYINDKNEAISIILHDSSLQNYVGIKNVTFIDFTVDYYDLEKNDTTKNKGNYMKIEEWVIIPPPTYMKKYSLIVDLKNKSIVSERIIL